MTVLALLILGQNVTPKAVLNRYAVYRRSNPTISMDWTCTRGGKDAVHGTILVQQSKRMLFRANEIVNGYSLSETELGGIEIANADSTYDEFPAQPQIVPPQSRISPADQFVPSISLKTDLYVDKIKYGPVTRTSISGSPVDVVSWSMPIQGGKMDFTASVDLTGRLLRFSRDMILSNPESGPPARGNKPSGGIYVWSFTNIKSQPNAPLSAFYTPLPKGYVPYSLSTSNGVAIAVDGNFPNAPWTDAGRSVNLASISGGKPSLIVITAPDCDPSDRFLANIGEFKSGLSGTPVAALSLSRTAAASHGLPFDSTGKASAAIGETSTPLFVLVNGQGKITNLWAGYDPAGSAKLLKDVQAAIKNMSGDK